MTTMNEEYYIERRSQLIKEFWFNKSKRCKMNARARIRAIAKLDFQQKGIPIKETYDKFHYAELA